MKPWIVTVAALVALLPAAPTAAAVSTDHTARAAASDPTRGAHTGGHPGQDDTSWSCGTPRCKPLD
ncbi:hypothetical protein [Streptomyces sp. NPDC050504]|uniref:hypothetical protein n=1 Tax=Streptomyces sp. NPDC050504 TaxID=3365618 RepID=UPI0037A6B0BF